MRANGSLNTTFLDPTDALSIDLSDRIVEALTNKCDTGEMLSDSIAVCVRVTLFVGEDVRCGGTDLIGSNPGALVWGYVINSPQFKSAGIWSSLLSWV